jgi:fibronectin-binding autotransporter adhesin
MKTTRASRIIHLLQRIGLFLLVGGLLFPEALMAANYYFDVNNTSDGSGITNGLTYTPGTTWNPSADGTGTPVGTQGTAFRTHTLVFSAGTDASNRTYTISNFGSYQPSGVIIEEGNVVLDGGNGYSTPTITIQAGANLANPGNWEFYGNLNTFNVIDDASSVLFYSLPNMSGRSVKLKKLGNGGMIVTGGASGRNIFVDVIEGWLRIENGNALFTSGYSSTVAITNRGTLHLANNITVANNALTLGGMGYNNLGALNNYSGINLYSWTNAISLAGNTRINASAGQLTFANGFFTNNYNLVFGGTGDLVVNNSIYTGTGSLIKDGSGSLTLGGTNTYSGATTVSNGTLMVASSCVLTNTSAISVSSGARFNLARVWDATSASKIAVSGAATVDAGDGVGVNMSGTFTSGTAYTILQAGSGLDTGNYYVINPINYTAVFSKSATQVQITPTDATPLTAAYWKGTTTAVLSNRWAASDGTVDGNWASTVDGALQALVPSTNANVYISATSPTVIPANTVLGDNMSIKSLTIQDTVNGLNLTADGNTLMVGAGGIAMNASVPASTIGARVALGAAQTWTNNSANPLTFNGAVIPGGNTLTKAGSGTISLSGANALGTVVVAAGTLQFNNASIKAGPLTLNGGTLDLGADVTISGNGVINGSGGKITSSGGRLLLGVNGADWTTTGTITNEAVIANGTATDADYYGGGVYVLKGASTYTGTTRLGTPKVRIGVSCVGSVGAITSGPLGVGMLYFGAGVQNAAGLMSDGSTPRTLLNPITFDKNATLGDATYNGKLTFSANADLGAYVRAVTITVNSDVEFAGAISNIGGVTKAGTAKLTLSGVNTFTGALTISAGLLAIEGAGQLGSGDFATNIINNATFLYNSSADQILGGDISGTGSLTKTNASMLVLNGTVTGAVTVAQGALGGTGTLTGTVTNFVSIGAATASTIGTLSVANLVMKENSACIWNYNDTTNDVIQVSGTLSLPTVATVNVSRATSGQLPKEGVLFAGTTLSGASNLSGWVVRGDGVRKDTRMLIRGSRVIISSMGGTLISFQ